MAVGITDGDCYSWMAVVTDGCLRRVVLVTDGGCYRWVVVDTDGCW